MLSSLLALVLLFSGGPADFGLDELDQAFDRAGLSNHEVSTTITGEGEAESFTLRFEKDRLIIEGADKTGVMYGALEAAERVRLYGAEGLKGTPIVKAPFLKRRGLNLFLTLPWDYEKNDTCYDPEALVDPKRWWFQNDDYWRTLLDAMARSRLNWLDLHGMWDVSVTSAPNLYAYFIQSDNYPEIGVAPEIKTVNLKRLNRIIAMAAERGITVSLMAYEARITIPQNPNPPYARTEELAYDYTREMVEKMIRQAPGLHTIGFRIGESGRGGEFFNCYLEAVERSGRDIPLITRSWVTTKAKVAPLARKASDFTVEIKYNGEQWAAPYPIAGGRTAGWYSYSFEDYLSDSGDAPMKTCWPGHDDWPDQPYKIAWQVRANGTHRILPFYEPDWVRRSIRAMKMGTASGYTVEPLNAYYPASPRYYLADSRDAYCDWIHERDEPYLMIWGRLGYDPDTPDAVFDAAVGDTAEVWKAASRVIPTAYLAFSLGPDHRNHAPELEWGGDSYSFIDREPFDSHTFMSMKEAFAIQHTGGKDGRLRPWEAARILKGLEKTIAEGMPEVTGKTPRERVIALGMAKHLARYYANRILSAYYWARGAATGDKGFTVKASSFMDRALEGWRALAHTEFYKPFTERLRMRTNTFHWKNELPHVEREAERLRDVEGAPLEAEPPCFPPAPASAKLEWMVRDDRVIATVPALDLDRAWILRKPLPSTTYFHKEPMARKGEGDKAVFEASFPRENYGHALAAEVDFKGTVRRIPAWDQETPYLIVPSRQGPTPLFYSSEEALTHLDPEVLSPEKHGPLLVCQRGWHFHRRFPVSVQRKLLEAVERGMTLIVMQQDLTSGRYPMDWLPVKPRLENRGLDVIETGGALGLPPRIEAPGICWQPFVPCEGWTVHGNGGLASMDFGKGTVWMVQVRLMQNMHLPACAEALQALLSTGDTKRPRIVVDGGSEGGHFVTSLFTDFMNAHELPFLTLGEVIAKEQGVGSEAEIPGRTWDDSVLEGRGGEMVKTWLEGKMLKYATRPLPESRDAWEREKPALKREFLRCLGLDPLPPRTPLNARITGVIRGEGYRIEKIVFESRPGFPVTAHLYLPDPIPEGKLPVIVDPHGHWWFKKAQPEVQTRALFQVSRGYLALVVDSPGHSFEGDSLIERRYAGTHLDLRLTLGSFNATGIYVWDLMRALDYLETRPEVDMTRVGLTGTSGGGLATFAAFPADDRFTCAVPVCYAVSFESNLYYGCNCNHIPGSLRVGDRPHVLALRAPAPVFVIGAIDDVEFPPEGTKITGEKLKAIYGLYGKDEDAWWKTFPGGHGYDKPMREAMMGFFDLHLKGIGDGAPVAESEYPVRPQDSRELLCMPEEPEGFMSMRAIAEAKVKNASGEGDFSDLVDLNGGLPEAGVDLEFTVLQARPGDPLGFHVTFTSEPGLTVPGLLLLPEGEIEAGLVLVAEGGKRQALDTFPVEALRGSGVACLLIDVRGFGELPGLEPNLMAFLGIGDPFAMAWDAAQAARAMLCRFSVPVGVAGRGSCGAQIALFAALMEPRVAFTAGLSGIREHEDCFRDDVPTYAIQTRAAHAPRLSKLRSQVTGAAVWSFLDEDEPDLMEAVRKHLLK